jgi:hypothetical protein
MDNIEDHFIVEGEERFIIEGEEYVLTNAEHAIIDGEEYVLIGENFYLMDTQNIGEVEYEEKGSILSIIFSLMLFAIVGCLIVSFALGFIGGVDDSSTVDLALDVDSSIASMISNAMDYTNSTTRSFASFALGFIGGLDDASTEDVTLDVDSSRATMISNAMDYTNPTTRDFALSLIDKSNSGSGNFNQVCDMWDHIYNEWTYVHDTTGSEYFSSASETINVDLKGDCDDFAILVGSVIQATGSNSRIIAAQGADGKSGHAYSEICVGNEESLQNVVDCICYRYNCEYVYYTVEINNNGDPVYWVNLDWQSNHPGGEYYRDTGVVKAYYPNGYWEQIEVE